MPKKLKIKSFKELRKIKNKGYKNCIIIGSSPRIKNFNFKKFKGKKIVIGDTALRLKDLNPDYWIACNPIFPVPGLKLHSDIINRYKKMIFIYSKKQIEKNLFNLSNKNLLKIKFFEFDDSSLINQNSINYNLQKYIKKKINFKIDGSVFVHSLAIAIILGFKKIEIIGVDLPMKNKEYKYVKSKYADKIVKKTFLYLDYLKLKKNFNLKILILYIFKYFFYFEYIKLKSLFFKETDFYKNRHKLKKSVQLLISIAKKKKIEIVYDGGSNFFQ